MKDFNMIKEIKCGFEKFEKIEEELAEQDLSYEDCGGSGKYHGAHWFHVEETGTDIYVKDSFYYQETPSW